MQRKADSEGRGPGMIRGGGEAGDRGRSDEISLADLVRVLRRRKQIIARFGHRGVSSGQCCIARVKTRRYEADR